MARIPVSTRVMYAMALALAFGIAFFMRVYFPYDHVFAGDWVRFQETDAWLHMQVVENLVQHFPRVMSFDPFTGFPLGQSLGLAPLFDMALGSIVWVLGFGSPSKGLTETVGAYFPAILGALVTIPVFFIGKELFNKKAGLLAAGLIAILPGEFLYRSLLGFTDHHVAEVLLSAVAMLFFILAMKSARGAGVSFSHVRARDWGVLRRPLVWSALAGLALGLYLLTWSGGALFLLVIFAFAVVQYIMDHLRRRSTDYLCIVAIPALAVSLVVIAPAANGYSLWNVQAASVLVCALAFLTLSAASVLMVRRNLSPAYYAVAIVGLGAVGLGLFYAVAPDLLETMLDKLDVLRPTGGKLTVSEAQGMSISDTWEFFTTGFWLSMASLALLAYIILKEGAADKTLLFVWSMIMLIAAFGQQRFAYYLAINVALLTAYLSWRILELAGFADSKAEPVPEAQSKSVVMPADRDRHKLSKKAKRRRETQRRLQAAPRQSFLRRSHAVGLIALIGIFFLAFFPNIGKAVDWAEPRYGPSDDWHEALTWMQKNTPDPFGNPDFYFERHEKPPRNRFDYPESAYGVMAWWDPGNWITYMAHRIPNASSRGQRGATDAAEFLLAQDEASANKVLDRLGSRYVIIEAANIVPRSRFGIGEMGAFITWAGQNPSSYVEVYYQTKDGQPSPVLAYHPAYYRSMISRLYIFGGREWVPDEVNVVDLTRQSVTGRDGKRRTIQVITDQKTFGSYEQAQKFLNENRDYTIVGTHPYRSPVPLEALEHYELIHKSPKTAVSTMVSRGPDSISEVEIFEYSP